MRSIACELLVTAIAVAAAGFAVTGEQASSRGWSLDGVSVAARSFETTVTPVNGSRCLVELRNFCVSERGIHVFGPLESETAPAEHTAKSIRVACAALFAVWVCAVAATERCAGGGLVGAARAALRVGCAALCSAALALLLSGWFAGEGGGGARMTRRHLRAPKKLTVPYCQEMSEKDPGFRLVAEDGAPYPEGLVASDSAPAYIYPSTPFWATPFHLWLSTVAAFDTTRAHGLLNSPVYVQWYLLGRQKWRWMPDQEPRLRTTGSKEGGRGSGSGGYSMAPLLHCLGSGAVGLPELGRKRVCYKRGFAGSRMWGDGLPLATTNNSFGAHFEKELVRGWMERVAGCVGWNMRAAMAAACTAPGVDVVLLQRRSGRKVLGEEVLLAAMQEREGWEARAVYPEALTFVEQLALFARTDVMVSAYGSGLTWLPFLRRGTVVLAIIPQLGAGGDKYLPGLHGPNEPVNLNTAFGTWAQHLNYYTVTSGPVPQQKFPAPPKGRRARRSANWKYQDVSVTEPDLAEFLDAATQHLSHAKQCVSW
eukprot:Rhum_TRINITY_DN2359_c0_g2::Rhum_TRINITY_DN2359_c0_g2_i1::g.6986::m.6986